MTKTEFEQLRPEFSVVIYANHNYIVAEKKNNFGVDMVGIYDEFPLTEHIDYVKAESCVYNPHIWAKDIRDKAGKRNIAIETDTLIYGQNSVTKQKDPDKF
jgi:hypothetical protein